MPRLFQAALLAASSLALLSVAALPVAAAAPDKAASETSATPTIEELLDATDDYARGTSSEALIEMRVKTKRYERTVKMRSWSEGEEKSLVRIEEPAKEKGVSTLKVDDNIWNYLPKVDRTVKVPAAMMSGSWMGSHLTNDDLVKGSRYSDDYEASFAAKPGENGSENYVIELVPKPDAPVVWGLVVVTITADKVPVSIEFKDEKKELVRTQSFSEVKELDGRKVPTLMRVVPADEDGEFTEMRFVEIDFDVELPKSTFTLQALRR
jgi:outer membrane lipoprotein-sorting protein